MEPKLLTEEKLEFNRYLLIYGNLAVLAWIFLAFFGLWFFNQISGWLLLIFNASLIYVILRRLGCSSCYYCKTCTSGFGRIAGAFFGIGATKTGSIGNRKGAVAFVYFCLFPLPTTFLIFSLIEAFTIIKVLVLVCLLAIAAYSLATWRKPKK